MYSLFVKETMQSDFDVLEKWQLVLHKVVKESVDRYLINNTELLLNPDRFMIVEAKDFSFDFAKHFDTLDLRKEDSLFDLNILK